MGESNNKNELNTVNGEKVVKTYAICLRITPLLKSEQRGKGKIVKSFTLTHVIPFSKRQDIVGKGKVVIARDEIKRKYRSYRQGWDLSARLPKPDGTIPVTVDYGKMVEADVVATWGARSPAYKLYVLTANVSPADATEDQWDAINVRVVGPSKITGDGNNRGRPRLRLVELPKTMKVRALRFEYFDGVRRGKDGPRWIKAQPQRINCDRVELLRLRGMNSVRKTNAAFQHGTP